MASLEEFQNKNYRFFYEGIPLKEYCEQHPEINYHTIRSFINREIERNPNLSIEDAIELYILKEHKGRYKYYYCGMPLVHYCESEENNIKYENIIAYIKRHKKEDMDSTLSDDEYIEIIMDQYEPFELKYPYEGLSLRQYCLQNSLSYYSIVTYVKRKRKKNPNLEIKDLIEEGIQTINRYGIIYYYEGIPLKDYCKEHKLNVNSIRSSIIKKKKTATIPLQEIVNECVENYQELIVKYFYGETPLYSFCKQIGVSYSTILSAYSRIKETSNLTTEEIIKEIVDGYIKNPPIRTKYYVTDDQAQSLRNFCNKNGYSYLAIWSRIKLLEQKEMFENEKQCMMYAIEQYEKKLQIGKINNIFEKLKQKKFMEYEEKKKICEFLQINQDNVDGLIEMDFSLNQAINTIWYFSDRKDNKGNKFISDKKLREVFATIDQIKNANDTEIINFELYDLMGIYKSELYDTRTVMLIKQKNYLRKIMYSLCREYNIILTKDNFEEFESEIKSYFIMIINRSHLNHIGQIIKYMDISIKGYFRTYLKKVKKQMMELSLDETPFNSEKGNRNTKTRLDYIEDKGYNKINKSEFSEQMMRILKTLSQEDFSFVILKFQEEYSDEELANYFEISLEEVKEKEISILTMLKNKESIQKLQRVVKG